MTTMDRTSPISVIDRSAGLEQTPPQHHPHRWRLHRAGMINVWHYYETEFAFSGGRLVLRGTNGSGKSRALEMLLPFLLDGDRRRMDATGSGRVRLEDLMRAGGQEQTNRLGYLWLELIRHGDGGEASDGTAEPEYITLGALVRFAKSTGEAKAWYFTTPCRVGHDLILLGDDRTPLSREGLAEVIGADRIADSSDVHRERVRATVFGLTGDSGKERFAGLLQLLRTLRAPDVGNRIDEGRLPQILADALPPPSEAALSRAGEQLDGLSETRAAQQRLEMAYRVVSGFLDIYRRYAVGVLSETADAAQAAVTAVRKVERRAEKLHDDHVLLAEQHMQAEAKTAELATDEEELRRSAEGIRASKAYGAVRDLDERERKVQALGGTAELAIRMAIAARIDEASKVAGADERAREAVEAARIAAEAIEETRDPLLGAGVRATMPGVACVMTDGEAGAMEMVRLGLHTEPEPLTRPVPARLETTPSDLGGAVDQVNKVSHTATQRGTHAGTRLEQARRLDEQARDVESADRKASEAEQRLTDAVTEAEGEERARDAAALALARDWTAWITGERTRTLLSGVDWAATALRPVLDDTGALVGDDTMDLLTALDHVVRPAADAVHDRLSRALAMLDSEDRADRERRQVLEDERKGLLAARDPDPPLPHWTRKVGGDEVPLWRAVDFAAQLDEGQRAGLEGALLASGLLTATITGSGLAAPDGRLLLRATGPLAANPLSDALVVETASALPAELVRDVLDRVALGDQDHPTWVDTEGAWGNGPLTGRHRTATARHIGAAARAAARAARLTEIDVSLAALAGAAENRALQQEALHDERDALDSHLRTAPTSESVRSAHTLTAAARQRVKKIEPMCHEARKAAVDLRREWTAALAAHRAACAEFDLPTAADELSAVQDGLRDAVRLCGTAAQRLTELRHRVGLHANAVARARASRRPRHDAEVAAAEKWGTWYGEAAELAAIRENVGATAEQARADLHSAEAGLVACRRELESTRKRAAELAGEKGKAEAQAQMAREDAQRERVRLTEAAERLLARLTLPGVAAAATGQPHFHVPLTHIDPPNVEAAVGVVMAALDRRGQVADENALIRAQQMAERELAGGFDVIPTVRDGVRLTAIADATGQRSLSEAAADLHHQCEAGRLALSDRERRVFTEFILGGVAEELRQRLKQAKELIQAMNVSLAGISTSHGIGVKLRWNLSEAAGPTVARIRALVATAGDVRSPEQENELTELLNARVSEEFATDPTAGYATHLKSALDYRSWHEMEVVITGPAQGQERKISRRAKLSQGEIRFVSYVTLFAAADAYLSGLPDTARALRLILLDDAFAKVDNRTIGELMGLLVRLDLDFAMTGHALWGFYPQVPSLDCYEIRRGEGTAAVTTRIHWDGHNRHLRPAR
ncbi:TIGR02680 family protein [Streptosporangium sp. NPDC002607]